jgi:hypothetical protein
VKKTQPMRVAIDALARHITSHSTATAALNAWCARRMARQHGSIVARVLADEDADPASYKGSLTIENGEQLRYRKVALVWGDATVSEAENWYFPNRLPPAMRTQLLSTNLPFGQVVRDLQPQRTSVAIYSDDDLAKGGFGAGQCIDRLRGVVGFSPPKNFVLHISAVVTAAVSGLVIAEVHEHYRRELIDAVALEAA